MEKIRNAEIICVGTELLLGDIINTNASYMSQKLASLGIPVFRQTVVGDNPERLKSAIADAFSRADAVFFSGGLGPTCDDLTKETVADYFGLPMYLDTHSLDRIKKYFNDICRKMPHNNEKQAMIPEGAVIFDNNYGTAPAIAVVHGGKTAVLLPGPPSELEKIWPEKVEPYLLPRTDCIIVSHNLHIMNMGESTVEEKLRELMLTSANPTIAPYAKEGEVRLRVSARAATREIADKMCFGMIDTVLATEVGQYVYGIDVGTVENALIGVLREKGMTVSAAESCTGGYIAKRITDIPGCSDVFTGSCVTYSNEAKMKLLGVSAQTLDTYGAVSGQTAAEMAKGVRLALGTDVGLAATGIAGPGGGTADTPVGTVFIAVSTKDGERVEKLSHSPLRTREFIRYCSSSKVMNMAIGIIKG